MRPAEPLVLQLFEDPAMNLGTLSADLTDTHITEDKL